jgi:hypothetical protein
MAAVLAGTCGFLAMALPAHAHMEGACKADVKKFCGDLQPGGGAIRDCMKKHESELSQACKDNIAEAKQKIQEKMAAIKDACKQDLQKYCANVTPGEGREMACLKSYSDKISASCKEKLPKGGMHKGMHKDMHKHGGDEDDHEDDAPPAK